MTSPIHGRYERTPAGLARIDLSIHHLEDLYNRFDRSVPYPNRNLDGALVAYLVDCATELDPAPFAVWFHLAEAPDPDLEAHARDSLARYFAYREALERQGRWFEFRRSLVLFAAGASLLAVVQHVSLGAPPRGVAGALAIQGLTVASWVLLWESFGDWFIRSAAIRARIRVFRALGSAGVGFVA